MSKILAQIAGRIFTVLGYDGTDFRNLLVDDAGHLLVVVVAYVGGIVGIEFVIDGGDVEIADGEHGHFEVPFDCTLQRVTLLADQPGSIVIDIWKDTYANFPPTVADTITAAAKPTIVAAQKSQDSALTGWTVDVTAGDVLAFNVDSCTTIERVTVSLKAKKV